MAVLLLGVVAQGGGAGQPLTTPQDPLLPSGQGAEKVRLHCALCHGLDLVGQQRLSRREWSRVVDQMIGFGARLSPEDQREILDYLAAYLGPEATN